MNDSYTFHANTRARTKSQVLHASLSRRHSLWGFMGFVVFLCGGAWHKHNIDSIQADGLISCVWFVVLVWPSVYVGVCVFVGVCVLKCIQKHALPLSDGQKCWSEMFTLPTSLNCLVYTDRLKRAHVCAWVCVCVRSKHIVCGLKIWNTISVILYCNRYIVFLGIYSKDSGHSCL